MSVLAMRQTCARCGHGNRAWVDLCDGCGGPLVSPGRLRAIGVVYLVVGGALTAGIAWLMRVMAGVISHSGDPGATTRFTGTPAQAAMIFAALTFPLVVGVIGVMMGAWQLRYGRRNLALVKVALALYLVLWAGSLLVRLLG